MDKVEQLPFVISDAVDTPTADSILSMVDSIDFTHIQMETIPWDQWDFVVVAITGFIGGLCDVVFGRPQGFNEPHINNNSLFGLGAKINQYNLMNNPIDFQEPGAFGGNHRLYSYGHDLFRFFDGVRQTMFGEYHGISSVGWGELVKQFPGYSQLDFHTALLVNVLHLFKDFWTARSLPIPGITTLANLNGNQMPSLAEELYIHHGVNLRVLAGQALSVGAIELILRVYVFLRYHNSGDSKQAIDHKRDQLLLTAHSLAMFFNVGKVVVTKNPFLFNVPQLIMIVRYSIPMVLDALKKKQELLTNLGHNSRSSVLGVTAFYENLNHYASLRMGYAEMYERYTDWEEENSFIQNSNSDLIDSKQRVLELLKRHSNR